MIQFTCTCGTTLQVADVHAGRKTQCPTCKAVLTVPDAATEAIQVAAPTGKEIQRTSDLRPSPPALPEESPRRRRQRFDGQHDERQTPASSGLAVTSMVLGIVTFLVPVLASIFALILGFLALGDVKKRRLSGAGLAWTGIILGVIGNVMIWPYFLLGRAIFEGPGRIQLAANRTQNLNNIKQITLAMHTYHDDLRAMPSQALPTREQKPGLSWRVAILPYVEQDVLYRQFKLDEPWDGPHNLALLPMMPRLYESPGRPAPKAHYTYYQVFTGPNTPFTHPFEKRKLGAGFPDGMAQTLLIAEAGEAVPWTKPADIEVKPGVPLPKLGGSYPGGFMVGLADGSARLLLYERMPEPVLRMVIDPQDGQMLPAGWDDFQR